jgi:hypothetical protein
MPEPKPAFADSVFINCPFDKEFWPLMEAIVFCVIDCGFVPRCALEEADSGSSRFKKICGLVEGSLYAIHDLSRVEIDEATCSPGYTKTPVGLNPACIKH